MPKIRQSFDKRWPGPGNSITQDQAFMDDVNAIKALQDWYESQGINRVRAIQIALLLLAWETKGDKTLREICVRGLKTAPQFEEE